MYTLDNIRIEHEIETIVPVAESQLDVPEKVITELVNSKESFDQLQAEWDNLAEKSDAHVFQSFDWQHIWWSHFGDRFALHILLFRFKGRLIGVAPFCVETTPLFFGVVYRRLRFIGSLVPKGGVAGAFANYSPTDYLDIIADPDYEDHIAEMLLLYLEKTGDYFDELTFDEVPEDSFIMRKLLPEMERRNWSFKTTRLELCPRINLPGTIEEYLFSLSSKRRYELRYSHRAAAEKELFRVETVDSPGQLKQVFDQFVSLHQSHWNRLGYPGIFADPRFRSFLEEVSDSFFKRGRLVMKSAWNGQQCLAVDYALLYNNRVYNYQKAHEDDSELSKYGPGKTLFYELLAGAIECGNSALDLLRGDEKYKMRFSNESGFNWRVVLPDIETKKGLKYKWYSMYSTFQRVFKRGQREWLLLRIHMKQFGFPTFMGRYFKFITDRVKQK